MIVFLWQCCDLLFLLFGFPYCLLDFEWNVIEILLRYFLKELLPSFVKHVDSHVLPILLHIRYYRLNDRLKLHVLSQVTPCQYVIPTEGTVCWFLETPVTFSTFLTEDVPAVSHAAGLIENFKADWTLEKVQDSINSLISKRFFIIISQNSRSHLFRLSNHIVYFFIHWPWLHSFSNCSAISYWKKNRVHDNIIKAKTRKWCQSLLCKFNKLIITHSFTLRPDQVSLLQ